MPTDPRCQTPPPNLYIYIYICMRSNFPINPLLEVDLLESSRLIGCKKQLCLTLVAMEELYDSSTHDGSSSTENLVSEIRKPSKKRVVVFVLLVLLLGLSIAFIVLYARGKTTETPTKGKKRVISSSGDFSEHLFPRHDFTLVFT